MFKYIMWGFKVNSYVGLRPVHFGSHGCRPIFCAYTIVKLKVEAYRERPWLG